MYLSVLAIGFFEHINLIYGTISEFCTPSTCPDMLGPGPRQAMIYFMSKVHLKGVFTVKVYTFVKIKFD